MMQGAQDAQRFATTPDAFARMWTNAILADLAIDLAGLRRLNDTAAALDGPRFTYQERAVLMTALVDGAAERLADLERRAG